MDRYHKMLIFVGTVEQRFSVLGSGHWGSLLNYPFFVCLPLSAAASRHQYLFSTWGAEGRPKVGGGGLGFARGTTRANTAMTYFFLRYNEQ